MCPTWISTVARCAWRCPLANVALAAVVAVVVTAEATAEAIAGDTEVTTVETTTVEETAMAAIAPVTVVITAETPVETLVATAVTTMVADVIEMVVVTMDVTTVAIMAVTEIVATMAGIVTRSALLPETEMLVAGEYNSSNFFPILVFPWISHLVFFLVTCVKCNIFYISSYPLFFRITEIALLLRHVIAVAPETAPPLLPLLRAETPAATAAIVEDVTHLPIAKLLDVPMHSIF